MTSGEVSAASRVENGAAPARTGLRPSVLDLALTAGVAGFALALCHAYVGQERFFYTADWGNYEVMAHRVLGAWRDSPLGALRTVAGSMGQEYNLLFTLPLVPWLLAFGESRAAYVSGLAIVYLVPFILTLGCIATTLAPEHKRVVAWVAVAVAILTPVTWAPTLRGMPDTGGALLLALAAWIYLRDPRLQDRRAIAAVGVLVAAAMLFRRHFAYAAIAFYASAAVHAAADVLRPAGLEPESRRQTVVPRLIHRGRPVLAAGAVTGLTLVILGLPFLRRVLTNDYSSLYAGYMMPSSTVLKWILVAYGIPVCLGAVTGYATGLLQHRSGHKALFIALAGGIPALLWVVNVRQPAVHYTLQFTPAVVLGIVLLGRSLWRMASPRRALPILAAAACYLVLNFVTTLTGIGPGRGGAGLLFAARVPPLQRADYQDVIALVRYLRSEAGPEDPIYVAAASLVMDMGTLRRAEQATFGWQDARLEVLRVPQVDSRDQLPLEPLLRAGFVVIVEPFQHTLSAGEHDVLRVVHDLFLEREEVAADFVELPRRFRLGTGATVRIFRRVRPTSEAVALRALAVMRERVHELPGQQPDWIALVTAQEPGVEIGPGGGYVLRLDAAAGHEGSMHPKDPAPSFVYVGRLPSTGVLTARSAAMERCPVLLAELIRVDGKGELKTQGRARLAPDAAARLRLPFSGSGAEALVLRIGPDSGGPIPGCAARLEEVRVRPAGPTLPGPP